MGEKYYFCNGCFQAQIENGILVSAAAAGDGETVPCLNEAKGFGNLYLTWEAAGGSRNWQPLKEAGYEDSAPVRRGRTLYYQGSALREELKVTVFYRLGESLEQEIIVENVGGGTVTLLDFGILLACHTDFSWGGDAGREMLGHHFVAGHGSRSTIYRCDGKGRILAVLPTEESRWIHYENQPPVWAEEGNKPQGEKGTVVLYSLDAKIAGEREAAGAKLRIAPESAVLEPGERYCYRGKLFFADHYQDCREKLAECGQVIAESVPGYTVPREQPVLLGLRCGAKELQVEARDGEVAFLETRGEYRVYRIAFRSLGECGVRIRHDGRETWLYYFVTLDVRTMMSRRANFIASKQIRDADKWYNGLLAEYNNETGTILSPDNYDKIGGWRIYEVTCDDPGLSKPAFLSSFQTVEPVQAQIDALDDYIEHFVWGGLQQSDTEPFPYGIYGIPDWHALRNSTDEGNGGKTHLWRIYDYPHIALLYYNMYLVSAFGDKVTARLAPKEYLKRAYGTARAMFTLPSELEGWSAYETGLYNELVIPEIIDALKQEGMDREARVLQGHWDRKAAYFVRECKDVFGSEYPFDTTGFESTHVLAVRGLAMAQTACKKRDFGEEITLEQAVGFLENQTACNIACRGLLEPAYFWYGSDYRGDNLHYTLSYMTQMGGCSLLDYACYYAQEPFGVLRLAYGSLLGSWALLNCGDRESDYGYWFPGEEKDGCACGGFEPLYGGETWLNQPHRGGAWYYSCEIDLGFCGGLRGAAAVVAEDPIFGTVCYGAALTREADGMRVTCLDGVGRKFHYIGKKGRIHAECVHGSWAGGEGILVAEDCRRIALKAQSGPWKRDALVLRVMTEGLGDYRLKGTNRVFREGEWTELSAEEAGNGIVLERALQFDEK